MPLNFPQGATLDEIYATGGRAWIWNGFAWNVYGVVGGTGATGERGATGATGPVGDYVKTINGNTGDLSVVTSLLGLSGDIPQILDGYRDELYLYPVNYNTDKTNYAPYSNYVESWTTSSLAISKNLIDPFFEPNNAYTLTRNATFTVSNAQLSFGNTGTDRVLSLYLRGISGNIADYVGISTVVSPYNPSATFHATVVSGNAIVTNNDSTFIGITGLDSGWSRIKIVSNSNEAISDIAISMTYNYSGFSGAAIGLFGVQLEDGTHWTTPSDYIDNPTASPMVQSGEEYQGIGITGGDYIAFTNRGNTFTKGNTFTNEQVFLSGISANGTSKFNTVEATNTIYAEQFSATNLIEAKRISINDGGNGSYSTLNNANVYLGDPEYYYSYKHILIHNEPSDGGGYVSIYGQTTFTEGVTLNSSIQFPNGQLVDSVVTAINGSSGEIGISAGTNITISKIGNTFSISSTSSGISGSYVSSVTGTIGEIEVNGTTGAVVVGLPNNVIITGSLTIGGITLSASGGNIIINGGISTIGNINSTGILSVDGLIISKTGFSGYTGNADLETIESVLLDGGVF